MLAVDVQIITDAKPVPAETLLVQWANIAYLANDQAEVALSLLGVDEAQRLNRDYRGKDKATNVLSFPSDSPAIDGTKHIGDIVICADVVTREATEQNKPLNAHWAHMVIHGMLHLQGYDHVDDDEAAQMEALEIELLAKLGLPDPYRFFDQVIQTAQEAIQKQ